MKFFNRLILVSSSMLASLFLMFSFNPSYRLSFNKIVSEFFDKNYLFDSYGQKIIINQTKPTIVLFADLGEDLREYFYENLTLVYVLNKFMEKNFEISVYLISAKSRNNLEFLRMLKEYANYYFFSPFSPGKSRFGTEENPNLRKKLGARDKTMAFIHSKNSTQDSPTSLTEKDLAEEKGVATNSPLLSKNKKTANNLVWDLENQGALLKEMDALCISSIGISLFEPFLPNE